MIQCLNTIHWTHSTTYYDVVPPGPAWAKSICLRSTLQPAGAKANRLLITPPVIISK